MTPNEWLCDYVYPMESNGNPEALKFDDFAAGHPQRMELSHLGSCQESKKRAGQSVTVLK